jgi:hypothetical protein
MERTHRDGVIPRRPMLDHDEWDLVSAWPTDFHPELAICN